MLTNCCLIFSFQKSLPSDIEGGACVVGYLDEYLSVSKPWVDVDTMICFDSFDVRQASAKNRQKFVEVSGKNDCYKYIYVANIKLNKVWLFLQRFH